MRETREELHREREREREREGGGGRERERGEKAFVRDAPTHHQNSPRHANQKSMFKLKQFYRKELKLRRVKTRKITTDHPLWQ